MIFSELIFVIEILQGKKKAYADLARQINYTKMEIDASRKKLDGMRDERDSQGVCSHWILFYLTTIYMYVLCICNSLHYVQGNSAKCQR